MFYSKSLFPNLMRIEFLMSYLVTSRKGSFAYYEMLKWQFLTPLPLITNFVRKLEKFGMKRNKSLEQGRIQKFFCLDEKFLGGFWDFFLKNPSKLKKFSDEVGVSPNPPPPGYPPGLYPSPLSVT